MFQIYKSHHKRVNLKYIKMHLQHMHLWHYVVAAVFYLSMGVLNGPDIRKLIKSEAFNNILIDAELNAWKAIKEVIEGLLGKHRSNNYDVSVARMLRAFSEIGVHMSLKIHYLHHHLDYFSKQLATESDEQGERKVIQATSHADVIRNFDLASPPQYTNSNGNSGGSNGNGDGSSSGSGSSSSGNSISNSKSVSPSLTSSSATMYASSSITSALVQAEAPSLETFVSAASTSAFVEPYLDGYATTNVTTQIGTHAYLPCRVKQLGNKSVSWIRVRDGHILTVDRAVFIADQRFLALKQPDKFWTLQIKYVQARDAGAYECQVSTEPKVSARVHLQVVVPRTEILGDPDRYVKAGSRVNLRCVVRGALEPPTFIMWYHGTEQLSAESRRHITQIDRNLPEAEGDPHSTIGSLIIESAKKRDTGNYTCSPSNSPSVTVTLNVINGESSASAVTSSAPVTTKTYSACSLVLIFSLIMIGGHRT